MSSSFFKSPAKEAGGGQNRRRQPLSLNTTVLAIHRRAEVSQFQDTPQANKGLLSMCRVCFPQKQMPGTSPQASGV